MFYDLCVPIPEPAVQPQVNSTSKKNKGKQPVNREATVAFSASQITSIEARVDLLVRLGYTIIALEHTIQTKYDPKTHENVFAALLTQLRKRDGILFIKRLTILLDEESDKGNGLSTGNAPSLSTYDIIALRPTTQNSLQSACLTHSQPSPQTAHIISLPLTSPRLPFRIKHTHVRTAIKNGAVFEINYSGALRGEDERRNWWTASRELVRMTKGKGLIVSSGSEQIENLRAPRDVENLITMLGLPQNLSHDAMTVVPRSLMMKSQTRKTYRAVLSEPKLVMPSAPLATMIPPSVPCTPSTLSQNKSHDDMTALTISKEDAHLKSGLGNVEKADAGAKRPRDRSDSEHTIGTPHNQESKKWRKKKAKLSEGT